MMHTILRDGLLGAAAVARHVLRVPKLSLGLHDIASIILYSRPQIVDFHAEGALPHGTNARVGKCIFPALLCTQ